MAGIVLVSGGLGFIGVAVAHNLAAHGFRVRLLDNLSPQIHGELPHVDLGALLQEGRVQVVRGDIRKRTDWTAALQDVGSVIHLAAETGTGQSMYRIGDYTETNVLGAALLLDILANDRHAIRKLVLASSRAIYGEGAYCCVVCGVVYPAMRGDLSLRPGQWEPLCPKCGAPAQPIPTGEEAKTSPASIYAATKLAQEDLVRIAGSALSIPFSILRFQNVYGEGQSLNNPYTGILSVFSNRMRQGKSIALFEDGQESRDFVHVSDVAEAVCSCLLTDRCDGVTMNVGSGVKTSIEAVALILKKNLSASSEIVVSGQYRTGDIRHALADISIIERVLGFTPKMCLEEGIERFARWVKTQPITEDKLDRANSELIERGLMNIP